MGKYVDQLKTDGYIELFFATRKTGLIYAGKRNITVNLFSNPSCSDEYVIGKEEEDFGILSMYFRDFYYRHSVVETEFGKLDGVVNKTNRSFLLFIPEKCVFIGCKDINEYLSQVFVLEESNSSSIYYRGQSSFQSWLPSLYRHQEWVDSESELNEIVIAKHVDEFSNCTTAIERLIKLKHFNQPSRLLDIVKNPLMALYFACSSAKSNGTDALVAAIFSKKMIPEKNSRNSDTVIELASLSNNRKIKEYEYSNEMCNSNDCQSCVKKELHSIDEKSKKCKNCSFLSFLSEQSHQCKKESGIESYWDDISADKLCQCIIVHPSMNNIRIIHQQGLFILCGFNYKNKYLPPDEYYGFFDNDQCHRVYFRIKKADVSSILFKLDKLGINESQVYFDLEKTIEYERNKVLKNGNNPK